MRLSSAVVGAAMFAFGPTLLAAEPCSPRPMRPRHVSAFVVATAPGTDVPSGAASASDARVSELAVQANCLVWEYSVLPRAEFIGTVPLGPPPLSAAPPAEAHVVVVVPIPSAGVIDQSSSPPPVTRLFDPSQNPRTFTLGATLQRAP